MGDNVCPILGIEQIFKSWQKVESCTHKGKYVTTLTMLVNPTDKAHIDFVSELLMEVVKGRLNAPILVEMFDKRNALGTGWEQMKKRVPTTAILGTVLEPYLRWTQQLMRERSGSVVEFLTQDRVVAGSSLTGVITLCPWARHINPCSVLVQPRKTRPDITEHLLTGTYRIQSNKQNNRVCWLFWDNDASILWTKLNSRIIEPHIKLLHYSCHFGCHLGYHICTGTIVRTGIQWTSLFCVYFVLCGLITQWPSEFNILIHRLIGDIFFVTQCIVKWAVIWWNLSSFEHLHFLIYPKCTFVRTTAFSLLSMNNYTVL